jgi:hypothetical protein
MDERYTELLFGKNLKGGDHSKDIDLDGRIISEWIIEKMLEDVD